MSLDDFTEDGGDLQDLKKLVADTEKLYEDSRPFAVAIGSKLYEGFAYEDLVKIAFRWSEIRKRLFENGAAENTPGDYFFLLKHFDGVIECLQKGLEEKFEYDEKQSGKE